jgi:hypothetical protein
MDVNAKFHAQAFAAADAAAAGDDAIAGDPAAVPAGDAVDEQADASARTPHTATIPRKRAHRTIG